MKLNLTDGKSRVSVFFDQPKEQNAIRNSKMPVSKALELAKKRLGVDCLWPCPGQALEGL